jgi:hypothetical protein
MKFELATGFMKTIDIFYFLKEMITDEIAGGLPSTGVKKFDEKVFYMETTICAL